MEQFLEIAGVKVLLTTGADRQECQQQTWWDQADVVISVDSRGAIVLKGARA
jgi:hypothetical protein